MPAGIVNFFIFVEGCLVWFGDDVEFFLGTQGTNTTDWGEGFCSSYNFPVDFKINVLIFQLPNILTQGGFTFEFLVSKRFGVVSKSVFKLS